MNSFKIIAISFFVLIIFAQTNFAITLDFIAKITNVATPKSVRVSPNGNFAVINSLEEGEIWIVDTKTFKIDRKIIFFRNKALGWDYKNKKPIPSFAEKPVECDFYDNGTKIIVSLHNDASVVIYDINEKLLGNVTEFTKKVKIIYGNGQEKITNLPAVKVGKTPKIISVTPDNQYALVSNWHSGSVSIISLSNLKNIKDVVLPKNYIPRGIAISKNSKLGYIVNMRGGTISVIDLEKMEVIKDEWITPNPRHIVLSPDGQFLYITDNLNGLLLKVSVRALKVLNKVKLGEYARTVALTPDGKYAFVALNLSNEVAVVNTQDFNVVKRLKIYRPMGVDVSPDGQQLWITSYSGNYVDVYKISY